MDVRNVALCAVLLASSAGLVAGDLPVHCLRHQVEGEWEFVLGAPSPRRSPCGHRHPDVQDGQPARVVVAPNATKRVELSSPNLVKTSTGQRGHWTMIYDEGFEVTVGNQVFFAFSNFTLEKDNVTHANKNFSHCGDTMVGWFRNADRTEFGCYYGRKVVKQQAVPLPSAAKVNQSAHYDSVVDHKAMSQKVAKLNAKLSMLQLGWKARVMPRWVGKTVRQINSYAGIRRTGSMRELQRNMMQQSAAPKNKRSFLQQSMFSKLPAEWDWSNVSDSVGNWLEPVMDQSDCGSCYAASTMRMLTTRHKIKMKDPSLLPWSINLPLFCGEYNQGCNGGYPFLMTKWSSDVGLLPATCMRYSTSGTCKLECDLSKLEGKRYRAANHRYIGSFYGNTSGQEMMQELHQHGPLVVSFEPNEDFMYYSDGIYRSAGTSNQTHRSNLEWEKVDHAVLLVGYGEEDGTPYWKIQNSWGPDWGEDGFFRMLRGHDESGIESISVAADVVEDERKGELVADFFAGLAAGRK